MTTFKCKVQRHKWDSKLQDVEVTTSKNLKGNKVWIKLPEHPIRVFGFRSFDGKGLTYQHPNSMWGAPWIFMKIWEAYPIGHKNLSKKWYRLSKLQRCISKAVELEKKVCCDLFDAGFPDSSICLLPESGVHSKGTDIVLTKHNPKFGAHPSFFLERPHFTVEKGLIAIEVLGTTNNHGNGLKFTYPYSKNFVKWMEDCNFYHTIPVIAWIEGKKVYYVLLQNDYRILEDIFFTAYNFDKYGYRQQKGFVPVKRAYPYAMTSRELYGIYGAYFIK